MGAMLGCYLGLRLARESAERQVVQEPDYLLIAHTPVFQLPPATALPTWTATPLPTVPTATPTPIIPTPTPTIPSLTPVPLPAIRLSIPAIKLNISVQEISPVEKALSRGETKTVWDAPAFAAGHYMTSGYPEGGRNIVFIGHNNMQGKVFRSLDELNPGDAVILFTEQKEFHYQVQKKFFVPYLGAEEEGDFKLQEYAAPQSTEMVTLISCWPYATNSHRIVIVAVPNTVAGVDGN
jgi:sortase A